LFCAEIVEQLKQYFHKEPIKLDLFRPSTPCSPEDIDEVAVVNVADIRSIQDVEVVSGQGSSRAQRKRRKKPAAKRHYSAFQLVFRTEGPLGMSIQGDDHGSVTVHGLKPDGQARAMGVKERDIVVRIDGEVTRPWKDVLSDVQPCVEQLSTQRRPLLVDFQRESCLE
jgi:S1-C subfamily serine protease